MSGIIDMVNAFSFYGQRSYVRYGKQNCTDAPHLTENMRRVMRRLFTENKNSSVHILAVYTY